MQYKILREIRIHTNDGVDDLEKTVNKHIEQGWEPIGGVAVKDNGFVFQAMIKRNGGKNDRERTKAI